MKDLRRLCKEFEIGQLVEVEDFLSGGYINVNLKIRTSKGKYVVRIFLVDMELERLQHAYRIISMLSKEGLPALLPLLNHDGHPYTMYKGYLVQVTPFIEAAPFQWFPLQAYHSGKMLRKIHQNLTSVKESLKATGGYQYYQLDPISLMHQLKENGHTGASHENVEFEKFYALMNQHAIDTSNLPKTIIHGDWNPWNQLYNQNGEVQCFMDFDTLQRGERIFDVAYALYFFLIQQHNEELGKEFLKGYGGLTNQEINVLPVLIAKISLYFGILVDQGDFQFTRNKAQMEWVISEQGRSTVQGFCIREA